MIINWLRISGKDVYSPSYLFWNSKYVVNIDIINYKIKIEQFLKLDNDNPIEVIKDKFLKNKTFIASDERINSSNIIASKKIQPLLNFLNIEEENLKLKNEINLDKLLVGLLYKQLNYSSNIDKSTNPKELAEKITNINNRLFRLLDYIRLESIYENDDYNFILGDFPEEESPFKLNNWFESLIHNKVLPPDFINRYNQLKNEKLNDIEFYKYLPQFQFKYLLNNYEAFTQEEINLARELFKKRNKYQSNNIELENISNFIMNLEKENQLIPMKINIMDFLKRIENKPFKNPKGSNLIEKSIILLLLNDIDNCLYYNQGSINFTNKLMKNCIKIYKDIDYLHKNANRMNLIAKNSKKELNNSYSALPKREKYNTNLETQKILLLQKNFNTKTKKADKLKKDAEKYPVVNNIIIQLLAWERNKIYDIINSIDIKKKKIYLKNDSDNIPKKYEYSLDQFSEMIKKGFFNNFFFPNGKLTEYYYTGVGLELNTNNN